MRYIISFIFSLVFSHAIFTKDYIIGVEDITYYPYYAYDKSFGEYKGIGREIFDEFSKYSGNNFKYWALPPDRLFSKFFLGELDFKYPDNMNWHPDSREDSRGKLNISYAKVMSFIDGVIINKEKSGEEIRKIVSVRGFKPWVLIDDPNYQIYENNDFPSAIISVLLGRADGVYGNPEVVRYNFINNPKFNNRGNFNDKMKFADYLPNTGKDFYYLSTLTHHKVIEQFKKFIEVTNVLQKLKQKYEIKDL